MEAYVSPEYAEYMRKANEIANMTLYEKLAQAAERILPISPWKALNDKYQEVINFSHMSITPRAAFSLAILLSLAILIVPTVFSFVFGFLSMSVMAIIGIFFFISFYYLYDYPMHYATVFKIKASSEMVLAVVYMTISMHVAPNLENAVRFAASNLTGPLAIDLQDLMWDTISGKFHTFSEALDAFIERWKTENESFTNALYLLKASSFESAEKQENTLRESVEVVLDGTKERMKQYARDLRTPITVMNAMGILLPIMGLIFFPLVTIFLPEAIRPAFLAVGYCILLPIAVYWMMNSSLEKRPYTFRHPDISLHPNFRRSSKFNPIIVIALSFAVGLSAFSAFQLSISQDLFSFQAMVYSLLITVALGGGIVIYTIFTVINKLKIRKEIVTIESEFTEALFQLANQITRGQPIESALKRMSTNVKEMKISGFFERIVSNMQTYGMTFEAAVFNEEMGAIQYYPSNMITAIMRSIAEISRKGMGAVSKAMMSISMYLKDMKDVEEDMAQMLSETTSTMNVQAIALAPLSSGIVVALAGMMMQMLLMLAGSVEQVEEMILSANPAGLMGESIFVSLINVSKMMPISTFQIIVGIYMIEVVTLLGIFISIIENGDEDLLKRYTVGKMVLVALIIYSLSMVLIYSIFSSMIPIVAPTITT